MYEEPELTSLIISDHGFQMSADDSHVHDSSMCKWHHDMHVCVCVRVLQGQLNSYLNLLLMDFVFEDHY